METFIVFLLCCAFVFFKRDYTSSFWSTIVEVSLGGAALTVVYYLLNHYLGRL